MHKTAFALLLLATAASALPSAPASYSARAPTTAAAALRKAPAPSLHLRGGGLPVNDVLIKTAIGGAMGALLRAYLQNWVPEISKHGPWKHIVGINMLGAMLLGIATHKGFPKDLAALLVPCFRICSAIITADGYNLITSGKEQDGTMYFAVTVLANLLMNHVGRAVIAPQLFGAAHI